MAKSLGCLLEPITTLKVIAANGNELVCNEVFKDFQWKMDKKIFTIDFLILPLDNYDMV